jgi:putative oxidoreductase
MKQLFHSENYPNKINIALFILRISAGAFMLTHGWGKFLKLIGDDPIQFADPLGVGVTASLLLTVFAEVFCSILLILGLTTRLAAIPSLITMLVAAFVVHANDGFGKMEMALLYGVMYLVIAIAGAGKYSLDYLIYNKLNK